MKNFFHVSTRGSIPWSLILTDFRLWTCKYIYCYMYVWDVITHRRFGETAVKVNAWMGIMIHFVMIIWLIIHTLISAQIAMFMEPTWDPDGPQVGFMNFALWAVSLIVKDAPMAQDIYLYAIGVTTIRQTLHGSMPSIAIIMTMVVTGCNSSDCLVLITLFVRYTSNLQVCSVIRCVTSPLKSRDSRMISQNHVGHFFTLDVLAKTFW